MSHLIVVEGLDFSGKTTLIEAIAASLRASGVKCITAKEPGGTPLGELIRKIHKNPRAMLDTTPEEITRVLMLNASRAENVAKVIKPALEDDAVVIVDRWLWSTLVYSVPELEKTILDLHRLAFSDLKPELTILLDIDYNTFVTRRGKRDIFEEVEEEIYRTFDDRRSRYLALAEATRSSLILPVNSTLQEKLSASMRRIRRILNRG